MTTPGYGGILDIDLTKKKYTTKPLPEGMIKKFLGGRGFGAYTLYQEISPGIDPLSPENVLISAAGPFTGTMMGKGTKYGWFAKSPLTEGYMDTYVGGHWGPELRYAGHSMVIFRGRSPEPTYVYINDDQVKFQTAKDLWGKPISETDDLIKEELGD
ncbi:MAG: aldehyde ferredoxin oxidoreductase N-terminal domain-containing protein, partial [Candidatus Ranarchaeia archaeon]